MTQEGYRDLSGLVPTLSGKVALVSGAGSQGPGVGTGRAAALLLAAHGACVLAIDRDLGSAEETAAHATELPGQIVPFAADLSGPEGCRSAAEAAVERWGHVDILDNNLGVVGPGTVLTASWPDWERVIRLNVLSAAALSAAVIPHMPPGGSIVNIASIAAFRPHAITPYSTSKGAVIALTQSMALDHAPAGIRVNCVAPGPIYTPMVAGSMTPELRERRRLASPLREEGTAWDIASAVRFLVSEEARWITGAVLPVDGGVSLQSPER